MKFRSFLYGLAAIALVLLLVGAGGAYWIAANQPTLLVQRSRQAQPTATMFVSKQAPLVVSLLVNPDRLEAAELMALPSGQRQSSHTSLYRLRQALLAGSPLSYPRDIQPWLGDEVTLAVTAADLDRDQGNGQQPGYLAALGIRDQAQAQETIDAFWRQRATRGDLVIESFAGVQIVYRQQRASVKRNRQQAGEEQGFPDAAPFPTFATAVIGDRFVLFANHPKVLREAINHLQVPELSLAASQAPQEALASLLDNQLGAAFLHLPQFIAWLTGEPEASGATHTYNRIVMALDVQQQGLLADALLLPVTPATAVADSPLLPGSSPAWQHLPQTSALAIGGSHFPQVWAALTAELASYAALAPLIQRPLEQIQQNWGVDFQRDVLSWLNGNYALALLPRPDRSQPDWLFVTERSEETTAGLAQLDQLAQQQGISVGSLMVGETKISAWTKLLTRSAQAAVRKPGFVTVQAEVQGVRTTVDDYQILASSLEAIEQAIAAPAEAITALPEFQQTIAPLKPNSSGLLYGDWPALRNLIQPQGNRRLTAIATIPLLDQLRSFSLSSYGRGSNGPQGALFIRWQEG